MFLLTHVYFWLNRPSLRGLRIASALFFGFLYTFFVKRLLFLVPPAVVHNNALWLGEIFGRIGWAKTMTRIAFGYTDSQTIVERDGIRFPAPIGLAAGFDHDGRLTQITPQIGFGFHTVGTVTLEAYGGNPGENYGRFPNSKALLVNKGLKSSGAVAVLKYLEKLEFEIPVGISIASTNKVHESLRDQLMDIGQSFLLFEKSRVQHEYYEMNISCPNTFGGEPFTSPTRLEILLRLLDHLELSRPVYLKMPIDQSAAESLALLHVADAHNIEGVVLGNLTKDKSNSAITSADQATWRTKAGNVSGKPTWERSNRFIALAHQQFPGRFTLIGTGGIFSPADWQHKQQLGAHLGQLITGMIFQGPQLPGLINAIHSCSRVIK
jgi:dihydroorotate dehydrogenase